MQIVTYLISQQAQGMVSHKSCLHYSIACSTESKHSG